MVTNYPHETFVNLRVNYTLETDGEIIVVENVPARVCIETGKQLFSPETVEKPQKMITSKTKPKRVMQVPVFEFA